MFPGAHYSDPEFSWKFEVAPAGWASWTAGRSARSTRGDLFLGAARNHRQAGHALGTATCLNLTGNRRKLAVDDPRLDDRVADNLTKHEVTESESLLFGTGFGVGDRRRTGPNGNLYVVSTDLGSVFEIHRTK